MITSPIYGVYWFTHTGGQHQTLVQQHNTNNLGYINPQHIRQPLAVFSGEQFFANPSAAILSVFGSVGIENKRLYTNFEVASDSNCGGRESRRPPNQPQGAIYFEGSRRERGFSAGSHRYNRDASGYRCDSGPNRDSVLHRDSGLNRDSGSPRGSVSNRGSGSNSESGFNCEPELNREQGYFREAGANCESGLNRDSGFNCDSVFNRNSGFNRESGHRQSGSYRGNYVDHSESNINRNFNRVLTYNRNYNNRESNYNRESNVSRDPNREAFFQREASDIYVASPDLTCETPDLSRECVLNREVFQNAGVTQRRGFHPRQGVVFARQEHFREGLRGHQQQRHCFFATLGRVHELRAPYVGFWRRTSGAPTVTFVRHPLSSSRRHCGAGDSRASGTIMETR